MRWVGWRGGRGVALALATVAWGGNQFTPLLVMYRQHSGFSNQAVTVLLAAYVAGIVPALLFGGPLSDRHGRRPLMYPAPAIAALGSLLLAAGAGSEPVLFIGRMLSGVALGLGMAVGTSWLKELRPASGGADASTALTLGFAVGAGAAAALAQFAPWPTGSAYLVHVGLAFAATLLIVGTPETRTDPVGRRSGIARRAGRRIGWWTSRRPGLGRGVGSGCSWYRWRPGSSASPAVRTRSCLSCWPAGPGAWPPECPACTA
ncbi:MFS transporter [Microlunatus sp. Gsoil 973]|uniref:MFS transporter n=1 Tax=Microlunatus sp. Gsoil 973 TaxID=2672569 RepID=UPI001E5CE6D3|nr:MFS transporter [Microlunatus sp. Gsoil 973]